MEHSQSCISSVNFAIIFSYIQKYANMLEIPQYTINQLENSIKNSSKETEIVSFISNFLELCQLHQFLLKKVKKAMKIEFWERYLIKFLDNISDEEYNLLYQKEYSKISITSKLTILKNLLESQFDENTNFKNEIINCESEEMRDLPIGRDEYGCYYWFQQDTEGTISLYKEGNDDQSWELICQERNDLFFLIESLKSDTVGIPEDPKSIPKDTLATSKCKNSRMVDAVSKFETNEAYNSDSYHANNDMEGKTSSQAIPMTVLKDEKEDLDLYSGNDIKYSSEMDSNGKSILPLAGEDIRDAKNESVCTEGRDDCTEKTSPAQIAKDSTKTEDTEIPRWNQSQDSFEPNQISMDDGFSATPTRVLRHSTRKATQRMPSQKVGHTPKSERAKTNKSRSYNRCNKCGKMKPSANLSCHDCKSAYHPSCLPFTYLIIDEEDQWLCPICEHKRLIESLSNKLALIDSMMENKKQLARKKERLAIAGINIANILDYSKYDVSLMKKESLGLSFGKDTKAAALSKLSALAGIRTCRIKKHTNYQFDEYDKLMAKAIKEQNAAADNGRTNHLHAPTRHLRMSDPISKTSPREIGSDADAQDFDPNDKADTRSSRLSISSDEVTDSQTHGGYFNLGQGVGPDRRSRAQKPQPTCSSLLTESRPRRAKRRPDRFDDPSSTEDRRYKDPSSSDSSEFEYGYKPKKSQRRQRSVPEVPDPSLDLFGDGYFTPSSRRLHDKKRLGKPLVSDPTKAVPVAQPRGGAMYEKTSVGGSGALSSNGDGPDDSSPICSPEPTGTISQTIDQISDQCSFVAKDHAPTYYKYPLNKVACHVDTHPLLNLCHMTSMYPTDGHGPTPFVPPTPPLGPVGSGGPSGPPNCLIFPLVNTWTGTTGCHPNRPNGGIVIQSQAHGHHSLGSEPGLAVIDVKSLLTSVVPDNSLW